MIATVLLSVAMTSGEAQTPPPRLLVLEPKVVNIEADDAIVLQRLLVQELARAQGIEVTAVGDLAQLADLGATQLEAGCDADACLAELAGALDADFVVFTEVGRLGDQVMLQLGIWDQQAGRIVSRHTVRARSLSALGDEVDDAIAPLLAPLSGRGIGPASRWDSPVFIGGTACAAIGATALAVGVTGLIASAVIVPDPSYDTDLRRGCQSAEPVLVGTAALGAVVLAAGVGLILIDGS